MLINNQDSFFYGGTESGAVQLGGLHVSVFPEIRVSDPEPSYSAVSESPAKDAYKILAFKIRLYHGVC
jgi:hypothetical protein